MNRPDQLPIFKGPGGLPPWAIAVGLLAAGAAIGAAHWSPALAPLAFLAIALVAALLAAEPKRFAWVVAGLLGLELAALWVGFPWHAASIALYLPVGPLGVALAAVGFSVPWVAVKALPLIAGAWAGRRWRWPVWAWLPVAWCAGEAAWEGVSSLGHDGWLYAQWQCEPVLRMLARLGWWPTSLLALAGAAALGQAIARRRVGPALAAGAIALAFFAMPVLPSASPQAFDGIGVVHMATPDHMPSELPPGVRLAIWPEMASAQMPPLAEGQSEGRLVAPIASQHAAQLVGLQARGPIGSHNAVVAVRPGGEVAGVRAKRALFPFLEREWLGLRLPKAITFVPGAGSPVIAIGERRVAALLCVEALNRGLMAQARAEGADLLVVAARDRVLAHDRMAWRQLLGVAVMRAVESGLPTVRASVEGPAALIGPDGHILSVAEGTGVLTGDRDWPALGAAPDTVVLYSKNSPWLRAALPEAACSHLSVEDFAPTGRRARTVVVAGHGDASTFLGRPAAEIARDVASLHPELVVVDTCFGASVPLLEALAAEGVRAHVVAPPTRIPEAGLVYDPGFLSTRDPDARAQLVHTEPRSPLYSGPLDHAALAAATARVAGLDKRALNAGLVSLIPPLIGVKLSGGAPAVMPAGRNGHDKRTTL